MTSQSVNVGQVIWISFKPIAKMLVVAGGGALCARMGILTPEASKVNSALILKLFLPLLIFATVVPSFERENMGQVGMVLVTGFLFQAMGLFFGIIVRQFTPMPKNWRGGVWAAGMMSNWGDLVIAYTATLAKSAPFNSERDGALGTAYSAVFIVSQLIVLFNFGGQYLVAMDFQVKPRSEEEGIEAIEAGPKLEKTPCPIQRALAKARKRYETKKEPVTSDPLALHPLESLRASHFAQPDSTSEFTSTNKLVVSEAVTPHSVGSAVTLSPSPQLQPRAHTHSRNVSDISNFSSAPTPRRSSIDLGFKAIDQKFPEASAPVPAATAFEFDAQKEEKTPIYKRLWGWLEPIMNPPSISLIFSLIVANVPQLKALFVKTEGIHIGNAPDGKPPLDIVMEIAKFSEPLVPILGLTLLGAAMSRLTIKSLPKGFFISIFSMSTLKLIVSPIIGIAWTQFLVRSTPFISEDDKMLQLVMIVSAGVPTATTIIYMTTMYAPVDGDDIELSALGAMMLGQYIMMLFTLTALVSYTLLFVLQ